MARLERYRKQGLVFDEQELEEFKTMYLSGLYNREEILEYFGISYYEYYEYRKMAGLVGLYILRKFRN